MQRGIKTFFAVKKMFYGVKNVVGGAVYRGDGSQSGLRVKRGQSLCVFPVQTIINSVVDNDPTLRDFYHSPYATA